MKGASTDEQAVHPDSEALVRQRLILSFHGIIIYNKIDDIPRKLQLTQVGDVKGLVLLDKDGKRIIAKYYKPEERLTNPRAQKIFEKKLFLRSNKYSTSKNLESREW